MRRLHRISREFMRWLALALALLLLARLCPATTSTQGLASQAQEEEELPDTSAAAPQVIIDPLNGMEVASNDLITRRPGGQGGERPRRAPPERPGRRRGVIEELVEGGVARFICLFLANESPALGPNRSVRPNDIDILYFLQPLLIARGGAPQVMAMVRQSGLAYLEEDDAHFWRDRSRVAPHNLYTSTEKLRAYLAEQGGRLQPADRLRPGIPHGGGGAGGAGGAGLGGRAGRGGHEPAGVRRQRDRHRLRRELRRDLQVRPRHQRLRPHRPRQGPHRQDHRRPGGPAQRHRPSTWSSRRRGCGT